MTAIKFIRSCLKIGAGVAVVETVCLACFAGNVSFEHGTPFRRADLDVRWNVPSNELPAVMWVYRALPTAFPPAVISNLITLGCFGEKDKMDYGTNGMIYETADKSRNLRISYPAREIWYKDHTADKSRRGPTNLSIGVPSPGETLKLTKDFLRQMGIRLGEASTNPTNHEPVMNVYNEETVYYVDHHFITNIPMRGVRLRRALDSAPLAGVRSGGFLQIEFGNLGKLCHLELNWKDFQRTTSSPYPTVSPATIVKWMREGKAVQGLLPMNSGGIDWATVKNVTVHHASPYYRGEDPANEDWLYPFISLNTTVDTGHGDIDVEIECPIIEDTKPLNSPEPK